MSYEIRKRKLRRLAVSGLAVGVLIVFGNTLSAASAAPRKAQADGMAAAQALVKKSLAPMKFVAPGPAFTPKNFAGKTVYLIPNYLAGSTFWENALGGLKDAAALFHVKVVALDPRFSISEAARLIDQAVSRKAGAIIIGSLPAASLTQPIQDAVKAGIPVIDDGEAPSVTKKLGVFGDVNSCYICLGQVLAAAALVAGNGNIDTAGVQSPEIPDNKFQNDGFLLGMKQFCPTCKVKTVNVPLAQWSTQLGPAATALADDPSINSVAPVWCDMAPFMLTAINASSASSRLKLVCQGANAQDLGLLKQGGVVTAIDTTPDPAYGWNAFDQVLRAWSGVPAIQNSVIPLRLINKTNAGSVDPKNEATWYGTSFSLANGFKKVWGMG